MGDRYDAKKAPQHILLRNLIQHQPAEHLQLATEHAHPKTLWWQHLSLHQQHNHQQQAKRRHPQVHGERRRRPEGQRVPDGPPNHQQLTLALGSGRLQ